MADTAKITEKLQFRKNRLLDRIRTRRGIGRLELARQLRMSNSRVCDLVAEMLDEGLLTEQLSGHERRGRRGVPLRVNPEYGHLVGFDMEAKRLRLVVVDFAGDPVWQKRLTLTNTKTRQALIDRVLTFIEDGLEEIHAEYKNVLGLGLAGAGVLDVRRGVILHYDLIENATDIPLRDLVASRTGLPCLLEENIRALTLAEWLSGAAQDLSSFVLLAIRSGVGAGIVINGRLHTGSHGFAGEAGYLIVPSGRVARQWKRLHDAVSEQALGVDAEAKETTLSDSKARRAGEILGAQLANLATILDPQAIVLAGELVRPEGPLWSPALRTFRELVLSDIAERVQVMPAQLGPFAAAVGAAHRCFQMLYPMEPVEMT